MIDCGNAISNGGALASGGVSDCNMLCRGNASEYCGAGNMLDVYQSVGSGSLTTSTSGPTSTAAPTSTTTADSTTTTASSGPSHVTSVGTYTWVGCYTEATNSRALSSATLVNYTTMTVEICAAFCAPYSMFGVEYSRCHKGYVWKLADFARWGMLLWGQS